HLAQSTVAVDAGGHTFLTLKSWNALGVKCARKNLVDVLIDSQRTVGIVSEQARFHKMVYDGKGIGR
ncbi:MAG: hypothetical protein VX255_10985, partial [Candidatus Latescibacterota bacterium]|nr:hypothetical protein [Candidatus Latescibacterota bacterium]